MDEQKALSDMKFHFLSYVDRLESKVGRKFTYKEKLDVHANCKLLLTKLVHEMEQLKLLKFTSSDLLIITTINNSFELYEQATHDLHRFAESFKNMCSPISTPNNNISALLLFSEVYQNS